MSQDSAQQAEGERRVFTIRAVLLGLLGALFVAGYAYFNDYGMKQNYIVGNHLPITIYSAFAVFLLVVNPLLRKFGHTWAFTIVLGALGLALFGGVSYLASSPWPAAICAVALGAGIAASVLRKGMPFRAFSRGELVVMLSMTLVAASLPTSGLMRNFPQMLVLPQDYGKAIPDWKKANPIQYVKEVNPRIFPEADKEGKVYDGYVQGIRKGRTLAPLSDKDMTFRKWVVDGASGVWAHFLNIPFANWMGPVFTWFPVLIVSFVFIVCLCRIVHRQWSENEQLSYPIAELADSMLRNTSNRTFSDVFYNRLFWIAFGAVLAYHIVNGWHAYDERMIEIPLKWNLGSIFWSKLKFLHHASGSFYLFYAGTIYLTVVAFAYFLPEEISLSLGISLPLFMVWTSIAYGLGRPVMEEEHSYMLFGSYVATAGVIVYTGRYYYWSVVKRAFFLKTADEIDRGTVWACRWFLAATIAFIGLLMSVGLDWLLSTMFVMIFGTLFLVLARVAAECGVPFVQSHLMANKIILAMLGPAALGPAAMYILQLGSSTFMQDSRECLSPYVANGLRLGERNGVGTAGLSRAMILALVLGLFAAGAGVLWVIYDQGALGDGWMGKGPPQTFAKEISRDVQKLKRTGKLDASTSVSGIERLSGEVRTTKPNFGTMFAIGVVLVLANSFLRMRYVWWPLHSVIFLFWNQWATNNFIWSFLLGWLIKQGVVRFGGGRVYQDLKPLFIGVIVADLLGGALWIVFGTLRYFWTGLEPIGYRIFPG